MRQGRRLTQFHSKMTFRTAYLWLAASCLCFPPAAAVILTDYFITVKSLLFIQSRKGASGSPLFKVSLQENNMRQLLKCCYRFSLKEKRNLCYFKSLKYTFYSLEAWNKIDFHFSLDDYIPALLRLCMSLLFCMEDH